MSRPLVFFIDRLRPTRAKKASGFQNVGTDIVRERISISDFYIVYHMNIVQYVQCVQCLRFIRESYENKKEKKLLIYLQFKFNKYL